MSQIAIKGADTGTGVFTLESPATNTDRTLVLPDEAGTVLTSASNITAQAMNGPVVIAWQSSAQSLSAGTSTKITFTSEDWDTANVFSSSRFTPNVAGFYQCSCAVRTDSAVNALHVKLFSSVYSDFAAGSFTNSSLASFESSCSGLTYCNGTTDYIEVYAYSGSNITLNASRGATYFHAVLVRAI